MKARSDKNSFEDQTSEVTMFGKTLSNKPSKKHKKSKKKSKKIFTVNFNKQKFLFYFCRIFPALVLAALFLFPMCIESAGLFDEEFVPSLLMPFKLPFIQYEGIQDTILHYIYFSIYIIPFTSLFLLVSLFIKDNINKILFVLTYVSFSIYIFCACTLFIIFATSIRWFLVLPVSVYAALGVSIICHPLLSLYGLSLLRRINPEYVEYKKMKSETKEKTKGSIKVKLIFTILISISIILSAFTYLILNSYKQMFTEAVSDLGRAKAEQTASVYESGKGMNANIQPFFEQQKEANAYAELPFERIDIITCAQLRTASERVDLLNFSDSVVLPDFDEFSYTTAIGHVSEIPENEKKILSGAANEYLKRYRTGEYKKSPVYDKTGGTCKYIYPVTFTRKDSVLLVGFSVVTYKEEVLMKSYFHTKVFVFTMAVLFLYISLFVSLLIADFITNPLLFLRANVKKTSDSLSEILAGNAKIAENKLVYTDSIHTRDETKELSKEIKNMVSLISRLIPYISFETLKNAEKDTTKKSSSTRELCFLFTDIRGFTSLCEGHQPKEVVDILNHYLDIETEIILNNGGDIDKFVGDEMMAFFSGPKKEFNACKAAMEIRAAMYEQHQLALENDGEYINMGIGINTGKVIFGSVGSRSRMDFTSIGDTVNLAARLESANKAYGSKSIITEAVFEKLKDTFVCRELDFITVKGKTEPVRIYEILQSKDQASEKLYDIKELFEKGLAAYRKQQWEKAEEFFRLCNEKYTDMPSVVFINRIEHFKTNPPPKKWDGVFVMSVK